MKKVLVFLAIVLFSGQYALIEAQEITMLGIGDSIGEGVQSADASFRTQSSSYLNLVANQIGISFPLPWIRTSPRGIVGDTSHRSRLFPYVIASNLAVSGATVHSIVWERADAYTASAIDSETDLVLFPRMGSQLEVVESVNPFLVMCWIGNNDVLSAAVSFDQLDASQLTPLDEFEADFTELVQRLSESAAVVVYVNIPDVTNIGFLFDRLDLIRFVGSDFGLPEGEYTTLVAMFMIKLGIADGDLLQDPDFVLDAQEVREIQLRTELFNRIIADAVASTNMPVVDAHALYREIGSQPHLFNGVPVTPRFLGGLTSLDGVHPSDTGHALMARAAIEAMNEHFHTMVPAMSDEQLEEIFLADPFIDKDGDGRVTGRPGAGLLETLAPLLGISGDRDDYVPDGASGQAKARSANVFLERYLNFKGKDPRRASAMNRQEVVEVFKDIFGTSRR